MYTFIHFREYVFGWGFNIVLVLLCFSFTPRVTGHVSVLLEQICGRVFQYSRHIQHLHFVLPSAKHRENEGEKLGQQPSAHCCHTDSLCSNDSGSAPPPPPHHPCVGVHVFYALYQPFLTHLPYASSFNSLWFDLASSVYPHNLFCTADLCTVLLCSALYLFLFSLSNISRCLLEI